MNILFISRELIAADLAYQLKKEGCNVKLFIERQGDRNCFDGIIEKTYNWEEELDWVGKDGLIIFDDVGYGEKQDILREEGYLVIGGSGDGDKLELNRKYGQEILMSCGVKFDNDYFETKSLDIDAAILFVKKQRGRWVLKNDNHDEELTYIGKKEDASDMISMLESYKNRFGGSYYCTLQKRIIGIEIAIGRFFNGTDWVGPIVFNREHKNFFNDDIGPLGGETGTLMWYEADENNRLFRETLSRMKDHLKISNYKGYVDINCMVTDENHIFPMEITSRFGSATNELQSEIQLNSWKDFLLAIAKGEGHDLRYKKGFGINVALTVPPFPYITSDKKLSQKGTSIFFTDNMTSKDFSHVHFEEVMYRDNNYFVAGDTGYVIYVTAVGKNVYTARRKVYEIINKIVIPKVFYRTDIGLRFMNEDFKILKKWRWI